MPAESTAVLENLAFDSAASELSAQLHPLVRLSVAEIVRSMNCDYSNLIEGHNTHPRDIDRALAADYSSDPRRRDLQLEARAHIEVQQMIDERVSELPRPPASRAFIEWTHREFCARLPESLLVVDNPDTRERIPVVPGRLRARTVAVGRHVAPVAEDLRAYPPGSVIFVPGGSAHFHAALRGEWVVQINSRGPSSVTYVQAADDPRL
jgi:hypothetical protein